MGADSLCKHESDSKEQTHDPAADYIPDSAAPAIVASCMGATCIRGAARAILTAREARDTFAALVSSPASCN